MVKSIRRSMRVDCARLGSNGLNGQVYASDGSNEGQCKADNSNVFVGFR